MDKCITDGCSKKQRSCANTCYACYKDDKAIREGYPDRFALRKAEIARSAKKHGHVDVKSYRNAQAAALAASKNMTLLEMRRADGLRLAKANGHNTTAEHNKAIDSKAAALRNMTLNEYRNRHHPTRKFKKSYCENIDGRLGFVCTTTIFGKHQLEVDHIDGNPYHEEEDNYQTFCVCCHRHKTYILNKDHLSPGRTSEDIRLTVDKAA